MVASDDNDRASHGRDDRGLVAAENSGYSPGHNVTDHGATSGGENAHHDARQNRQAISDAFDRSRSGPEPRDHSVTVDLNVFPGLSFEIEKSRNERTSKRQD